MLPKKLKFENELWWTIPQEVFLKILLYLETRDIVSFSSTCKRYYQMCKDDFLWRKLFNRDFNIQNHVELKPGADSWRSEYKRLSVNVPVVLTEVLEQHSNQVLHVSFSHNGEMFATCSKDANVIIWNSSYPCSVKDVHNMKKHTWKCTQFSQFNKSDTLLLVSGILFGSSHSTMGEIAVFSIKENWSSLRCRVSNRPYDIFGAWFSDQYLLSGDLHWLAHLVSRSVIWLNKASQEISSENKPIMNQMYKFYNRNASSIRAILIANCPWLNDSNDPLKLTNDCLENIELSKFDEIKNGNVSPHARIQKIYELLDNRENSNNEKVLDMLLNFSQFGFLSSDDNISLAQNLDEYRKQFSEKGTYRANDDPDKETQSVMYSEKVTELEMPIIDAEEEDDLDNSTPKYLIFFTGSKTYLPHEIGIKRIRNATFPTKLDPGLSLKERYEAKKREKEERLQEQDDPTQEPNWGDYDSVADRFDEIDKIIDLHGHIIGMALSPDHRFLYVNTRPWPKNYVITNPLEPPPIAQEIDIHVIDLTTLEPIGNILRAHKAYTSNTDCFFIFLNVCNDYVASGAEDKHAYLWDRFYGHCLAKYKHQDVVNSVAFNPMDSEMLVTTSDDYSIKIWRSKEKVKKLNIPFNEQATEFRKRKQRSN